MNTVEIIFGILIIALICLFVGMSIAGTIDKKLSDITITIPKIEIPETKVILRSEDIAKICTLQGINPTRKTVERFASINSSPFITTTIANDTDYITAEKFYNRFYYTDKRNPEDTKLIPANYSQKSMLHYASADDSEPKIIYAALAKTDITNIKPENYVFKTPKGILKNAFPEKDDDSIDALKPTDTNNALARPNITKKK